MKRLIGLVVSLALLTGIITGCAGTPAGTGGASGSTPSAADTTNGAPETAAPEAAVWPRTITDAAGHEVVLEKKPERITLLHTYYMEHFLLLGTPPTASAIGNALGQTEALEKSEMFAPYLEGTSITDLGSAREINPEAVLESEPDVIVTFSAQGGLDKTYDQLVQIAPVVLLDYTASWQEQLLDCAEIVGKETEARDLVAEIEKTISDTKEALGRYTDRTFALFRTDGKAFITRGDAKYYETFGIMKPQGYPDTYETVSLEAVAEMNPYYIVFQHNREAAAAFVESLASSSVWQSIDAVKNGRIYYFDENMNTFGPLALRLTAEKLVQIYSE
ncbi:iron complex transport system substrate-binding protein [Sporobacter termitidis DSM 10068]|uniref:Iron complex transport system substrate-binding protein n=1 Tax=Sporobacter termitidis DSM 10068 TaxID=1123282 RepID=A0A1M5YRD7_9FIRM|nr:ABC transporter substrate-binding protein [Sporobacter termitidis]SHI14677.1 iron complex transport system substrate-binding protein [Sporobacter termitidis DSM 10068]